MTHLFRAYPPLCGHHTGLGRLSRNVRITQDIRIIHGRAVIFSRLDAAFQNVDCGCAHSIQCILGIIRTNGNHAGKARALHHVAGNVLRIAGKKGKPHLFQLQPLLLIDVGVLPAGNKAHWHIPAQGDQLTQKSPVFCKGAKRISAGAVPNIAVHLDSLRSALQCSLRQRKIVAGQCSYDGKSVICEHFCIIHSVIPFLSRSEGGVLVPPPAVCRGRP